MGTNYYLHENLCPTCKRADRVLHIGKASAGWCFALRIYLDENISSLFEWEGLFRNQNNVIRNEYGEVVSRREMVNTITIRTGEDKLNVNWDNNPFYASLKDMLTKSNAVLGPNNLLRSKIDGIYCISHGRGTWDYIVEDFS